MNRFVPLRNISYGISISDVYYAILVAIALFMVVRSGSRVTR